MEGKQLGCLHFSVSIVLYLVLPCYIFILVNVCLHDVERMCTLQFQADTKALFEFVRSWVILYSAGITMYKHNVTRVKTIHGAIHSA